MDNLKKRTFLAYTVGGFLISLIMILFWSFHILNQKYSIYPLDYHIMPSAHHIFTFCYGLIFPVFFSFTLLNFSCLFPKELISYIQKRVLVLLFVAGGVFSHLGYYLSYASIGMGAVLINCGLCFILYLWIKGILASREKSTLFSWIIACCLFFAVLGGGLYLVYLHLIWYSFYKLSYGIAVHFSIPMLVLVLCYRNAFQVNTLKYPKLFIIMALILATKVVLTWQEFYKGFLFTDSLQILLLLYLIIQLKKKQNEGESWLQKHLNAGLIWMAISSLIFILSALYDFMSGTYVVAIYRSAVHALTIGCFGSIIISLLMGLLYPKGLGGGGQLGFALLFIGFQLVALIRILSSLMPLFVPDSSGNHYISALIWICIILGWLFLYIPSQMGSESLDD